tara:strand:- start:8985 stop:9221 length:237 start_codon:yes stop_codon:yes gene_type:complete
MCYYHHYDLFDEGYMGIRIECDGTLTFVFYDIHDDNKLKQTKSLGLIDIKPEYIVWKNHNGLLSRLQPLVTMEIPEYQ